MGVDTTDLGRAEESWRDSEERLRLTTEAAQIGHWELDLLTGVAQRSPRHDQIFGYSELLPVWTCEIFLKHVHPEDRARINDLFQAEGFKFVCRIIRTDQEVRWIWVRGKIVKDSAGQPARMVGIVVDITERQRADEEIIGLNERLNRQINEVNAVNQELEAFSYSVSHDLRAPLMSIDGFSQALLEDYADKLDAIGQDYLWRVRAASQRMAQLIDDLLSLSRVTRSEIQIEPVSISALAQAIAAELQQAQPDRRSELVIAEGLMAQGDPRL